MSSDQFQEYYCICTRLSPDSTWVLLPQHIYLNHRDAIENLTNLNKINRILKYQIAKLMMSPTHFEKEPTQRVLTL